MPAAALEAAALLQWDTTLLGGPQPSAARAAVEASGRLPAEAAGLYVPRQPAASAWSLRKLEQRIAAAARIDGAALSAALSAAADAADATAADGATAAAAVVGAQSQ